MTTLPLRITDKFKKTKLILQGEKMNELFSFFRLIIFYETYQNDTILNFLTGKP